MTDRHIHGFNDAGKAAERCRSDWAG